MDYVEIQNLIDSNLASGQKIPALKHREVEHALLNFIQQSASQSGDIKRVKCDLTYLTANFETDGLGKNLRLGWAICNGNNGTDNLAGRVGVGYGLGWSGLGQTGGAETHTLVEAEIPPIPAIPNAFADTDRGTLSSNFSLDDNRNFGGGQPHNNMQPYIIQLYIMKL